MAAHRLLDLWERRMREPSVQAWNGIDTPAYAADSVKSLITKENDIHALHLGTGAAIYETIAPAIEMANEEVLLVTCFWARSRSLDALRNCLRSLSRKSDHTGRTIRVRICFSSSSLFQKLLHTTSLRGKTWPPSTWTSKLGLPHPNELPGLDMEVKSIFVLPFSVMHPKFVVIDRQRVFLPSSNVSWEDWFEGCVEMSGSVVQHFVSFWQQFWASPVDKERPWQEISGGVESVPVPQSPTLLFTHLLGLQNVPMVFLLSPHHRNPRFALPWQPCPPPPPTPLNEFQLAAFASARRTIFLQTPNLTSPPVLSALLRALQRGVDVDVLTSEKLMIIEQLVTAGTTTSQRMKALRKKHRRLLYREPRDEADIEAGHTGQVGHLTINYFQRLQNQSDVQTQYEPIQSHLKLSLIDDETVIMGSGNMDRASWYTSQELGVAFLSEGFASAIKNGLQQAMRGRRRLFYSSAVSV